MTATDAQVRIIVRETEKGRTQEQAAASANVSSRKTVARHERLAKPPSEVAQPRRYRTRPDPSAEDLPTVETMLESAPSLEAKALFEWRCEQHPERYQPGQLRTFQQRVMVWRGVSTFAHDVCLLGSHRRCPYIRAADDRADTWIRPYVPAPYVPAPTITFSAPHLAIAVANAA